MKIDNKFGYPDPPYEKIDPNLVEIIRSLWDKKLFTDQCCQGRTKESDWSGDIYERKHSETAYILFYKPLHEDICKKAISLGLTVERFGRCLRTKTETLDHKEIIQENTSFPDRVRKLFGK